MKKIVLAAMVLFALLVHANYAWATSGENEENPAPAEEAACDPGKPVHFVIRDKQGNPLEELMVPEAFLYSADNIYNKVKDPADIISLRVFKKNFSPECGRGAELDIIIVANKLNDFAAVVKAPNLYQRVVVENKAYHNF
jgi:hypothetical protein